jgi:hypothetical protein
MAGGADQLHAARVRLVVRPPAREGWEEGVVDVDDRTVATLEKVIRQHLHVAGEDDEFDAVFAQQRQLPRLRGGLGFRRHRHVNERESIPLRHRREVGMVADDEDDIAGEVARAPPEAKVVEAVVRLGNEQGDPGAVGRRGDAHVHAEAAPELVEGGGIGRRVPIGRLPLDALEEDPRLGVAVLVGVQDVATPLEDPAGDARHEARLIRAMQQRNERRRRGSPVSHDALRPRSRCRGTAGSASRRPACSAAP